ncbi:ECF transporter S component [Clostridium lundense]|uniref:ECF transporter S component n=1 Tax=Clostridium lundense TaxID=319475 RepID=UPI00048728C6|nr:ECF transporter S component [Clostridium lundense]
MKSKTNKIVKMAMLCALSIVLMLLIRFPIIPAAPYLEYEPADVPILVGGFLYGPISALILTVAVSLIQSLTVSASSGWVGFIMHIISTGTFVLVASFIYKKFHTNLGATIALILGCICMTLIAIPLNLFFTVRFWGIPHKVVVNMIPTVIIPFNLIKSGINSVATIVVYKAIERIISVDKPFNKQIGN